MVSSTISTWSGKPPLHDLPSYSAQWPVCVKKYFQVSVYLCLISIRALVLLTELTLNIFCTDQISTAGAEWQRTEIIERIRVPWWECNLVGRCRASPWEMRSWRRRWWEPRRSSPAGRGGWWCLRPAPPAAGSAPARISARFRSGPRLWDTDTEWHP